MDRRLLVICLAVLGLTTTPASMAHAAGDGPQSFPNAAIADAGLRYVGQSRPTGWDQPGECIKWVQSWVREAGGHMSGGGPITAYTSSPATEVSAGEAVRGDVFQISQNNTYDGSPHTGVVLGPRHGDGTFDVVEGNIPAGSGRVRTHRRVLAAPAGHQLRFWRFGKVAPAGQDPIGHVDAVAGGPPGKLLINGWSFDPDTPTASTYVHVYVGGPAGSGAPAVALPANHVRNDVAAAYPGAGAAHGFDEAISGIGPGNHAVYVYAINTASGHNNPLLWSGTVSVPATAPGTPNGHFDDAEGRVGGKARVRGWAYDPDASSEPVDVHAYVDGWADSGARGVNLGQAATSRPDVDDAFPGAGDNHGFEATIDGLSPGLHTIYVYAINRAGTGDNPLLRVLTVNVPGPAPMGHVDVASGGTPGFVQLVGWTLDPDTPEQAIDIHVYIGGPAGSGAGAHAIRADVERPDVGAAFPGAGSAHGFSTAIGGIAPGPQPVFVYAINTGADTGNPLIWSGTVNVPAAAGGTPFGHFDAAEGLAGGRARVQGWAIDPDAPAVAAGVHAYVDGPAGSGARGIDLGEASVERHDVAAAHPGAGERHGFDGVVDGLKPGRHTLFLYAINVAGGGDNPLLGAITVTVPAGDASTATDPVTPGGEAQTAGPAGGQPGTGVSPARVRIDVRAQRRSRILRAGVRGVFSGPANTRCGARVMLRDRVLRRATRTTSAAGRATFALRLQGRARRTLRRSKARSLVVRVDCGSATASARLRIKR